MIDHKLKTIYLHIGKSAGSSIERLLDDSHRDAMLADRTQLYGWDGKEGIYLQHASAATVLRLVGDEIFDQYYKFTIVRNPYARMLSVYYYLIDQHEKRFGSFQGYVEALPELARNESLLKGSHYIPQIHYTHINGELICDYVGKFEALPSSIEPVRAELGIERFLNKHNTHRRVDWERRSIASYYTKPMQRIMKNVYAEDFACFAYSANPKDIPYSFWRVKLQTAKSRIKPYIPAGLWTLIR